MFVRCLRLIPLFFLVGFFFFGCLHKKTFKDSRKTKGCFALKIQNIRNMQSVQMRIYSLVISKIKEGLKEQGYLFHERESDAECIISLKCMQSSYKNPCLSKEGFFEAEPFFQNIFITLSEKKNMKLRQYSLVFLDIFKQPQDLLLYDWYMHAQIETISNRLRDKVLMILNVWMNNE